MRLISPIVNACPSGKATHAASSAILFYKFTSDSAFFIFDSLTLNSAKPAGVSCRTRTFPPPMIMQISGAHHLLRLIWI